MIVTSNGFIVFQQAQRTWPLIIAALLIVSSSVSSQAADSIKYNLDIRPILADHCFACHGADSASREADLRLDVRKAAIDAGAINPGKIDNSELIARMFSEDSDIVMPPPSSKKPLTDAQKRILSKKMRISRE